MQQLRYIMFIIVGCGLLSIVCLYVTIEYSKPLINKYGSPKEENRFLSFIHFIFNFNNPRTISTIIRQQPQHKQRQTKLKRLDELYHISDSNESLIATSEQEDDDIEVKINLSLMARRQRDIPICQIHYFAAGTFASYNMENINNWISLTDENCHLQIVREKSPVLKLTPREQEALNRAEEVPVVQADYLKLLSMYYLGGLVTDFDVAPLKKYPDDFMYTDETIDCDVFMGVEHDCYHGEACFQRLGLSRYGQIETWTSWSRYPFSPFLKGLVNEVTENLIQSSDYDIRARVQDIAGSGIVSDYIRKAIGEDYLYSGESPIAFNDGILKIRFSEEEETLCIASVGWFGGNCNGKRSCLISHQFEGSWKCPGNICNE